MKNSVKSRAHKALADAILRGDVARVQAEVALYGPNVTVWGGLPALAYAANSNQNVIVELLIRLGADVNRHVNGITGLMAAAGMGFADVVGLLLKAGANPNQGIVRDDVDWEAGYTPLMAAAGNGAPRAIKLLLAAGADKTATTSKGVTAVGFAVLGEHFRIALELLSLGCPGGKKALVKAVKDQQHRLVAKLLGAGADANEVSPWVRGPGGFEETPLGAAASLGAVEIIRTLVKGGARLDMESSRVFPLDIAAFHGHAKATAALIDLGAEVNAQNRYGNTALMSAASEGHFDVVRLLLKKGANPVLRLFTDETAIDFARANGHDQIVRLLTARTT